MINIRMLFVCLCLCSSLDGGILDAVRGILGKAQFTPPPKINVLVRKDAAQLLVEVKGKYHIYDPHTHTRLTSRMVGKSRPLVSLDSGIKWGEEFPGVYQIHLVPDDESISVFVDGVEYKGSLFIYDVGGRLSVVNRINVEEYLLAILPEYYKEPMSQETCAAAAIIERTCAVHQALHPANRFWAVDGELVNYRGWVARKGATPIERAIYATSYMVMSRSKKHDKEAELFPARWSFQTVSPLNTEPIYSGISVEEAESLSRAGQHAAQILKKAFPGTHIELIY